MTEAPLPVDEEERLLELRSYDVLDTAPERVFDEIASLASLICRTPIALVSIVDAHRQWFKSCIGLDAQETTRDVAFCSHAILEPGSLFVVRDPHKDARFCDNPLVTGEPHVGFYAGVPLVTPAGRALGTLCVIDHDARELEDDQSEALRILGHQVMAQLELRRRCSELAARCSRAEILSRAWAQRVAVMQSAIREPATALLGGSDRLGAAARTEVQSLEATAFREAARALLELVDETLEPPVPGTA